MSTISSINNLLSYGTSASYAAQRMSYLTKLSGVGSTSAVSSTSSTTSTKSGSTASTISGTTSAINNLNQNLASYKTDLADVEKAGADLSLSSQNNAFNYIEYGSSDEKVATLRAKDGGLSEETSFTVTVNQLADEKTGKEASYSITQNGVTRDYTSSKNEITLSDGSGTMTLKGTGTTEVYSGVDTEHITEAMQNLVDTYNQAVEDGKAAGASGYAGSPSIGSDTMKQLGLSIDRNGKMKLDETKLTDSLVNDFEGTAKLIGDKYGAASMIKQSASNKINDAITASVDNAYSGMSSSLNSVSNSENSITESILSGDTGAMKNAFSSVYQFTKASPYNMSNFYAVGSLFNQMA